MRNAGDTVVDTVALGSIERGVVITNPGADDETMLDAAVRENVRRAVMRLRKSEPLLTDPLQPDRLEVVGARYELDDGKVEFFI